MADRIVRLLGDPPIPFRAHDNGDGSFSLAVISDGAGAPTAFAFEQLTVGATAVGVTTLTADDATRMVAVVEGAQIRDRWDGGTPTASVGVTAEIGDVVIVEGAENLAQFKAIRTGATSGTLNNTYER